MNVTLQPSGVTLALQPGERILDGARRLGYDCPQSCRNGNCHICAALLVEGRVRQAGAELDHGELFTCLAEPLEDCVLHWDGVLAPGELPVRELSCQVTECQAVGGDVFRVSLRTPAGKAPRYHAGQYLLLQRPDGEMAAFSLASAPHAGRELELHILAREDSSIALLEHLRSRGYVGEAVKSEDRLTVSLPREQFTSANIETLQQLVTPRVPLFKKAFLADNVEVVLTDTTVNFPWFPFTAEPDEVSAYSTFVAKLCDMAKRQKRVVAVAKETDNDKYAFRCFLLRLGFIGDEYKIARKVLLRNLTGNSAFRYGAERTR